MTLAALWYTISCPLSPHCTYQNLKQMKQQIIHTKFAGIRRPFCSLFFFVAKINWKKQTNVFLPVGRWSNGIFVGLWPQLLKIQKKFFQNKNFKMFFFFNKKLFSFFVCVCVCHWMTWLSVDVISCVSTFRFYSCLCPFKFCVTRVREQMKWINYQNYSQSLFVKFIHKKIYSKLNFKNYSKNNYQIFLQKKLIIQNIQKN